MAAFDQLAATLHGSNAHGSLRLTGWSDARRVRHGVNDSVHICMHWSHSPEGHRGVWAQSLTDRAPWDTPGPKTHKKRLQASDDYIRKFGSNPNEYMEVTAAGMQRRERIKKKLEHRAKNASVQKG